MLDISKSDEKQYTLTLKDELLPKSPNGREQSTVSWEYDFKSDSDGGKVYIHWDDFKPTYRGREKKDTKPLDLQHIKRISFMMRRYQIISLLLIDVLIAIVSLARKKVTSLCQLPRSQPSQSTGRRSRVTTQNRMR